MRAGVLLSLGGAAAILVVTVPASAFNSGNDPDSYYGDAVTAIEAHRGWQGVEGVAFEPVGSFTRRLPDDEFDDLLLNLVNWFRQENSLPALDQFERLRAQSAIWSNKMADARSATGVDPWYRGDASAACNPLEDIHTIATRSAGQPQDVYYEWIADPATRNALLTSSPGVVGIATVEDGGYSYTTLRIAQGSCPGGGLPYRSERSDLPRPRLQTTVDEQGQLAFLVRRRGEAQLIVQVQRLESGRYVRWQDFFVQPGIRLAVTPPAGTYRVVVPEQAGYDLAMSPLIPIGPVGAGTSARS